MSCFGGCFAGLFGDAESSGPAPGVEAVLSDRFVETRGSAASRPAGGAAPSGGVPYAALQSGSGVTTYSTQHAGGLRNHAAGGAVPLVSAAGGPRLSVGSAEPFCKLGCGRSVQPGKTRRGNPYDTCCRTCAVNPGLGMHDSKCGGQHTNDGAAATPPRGVCPDAIKCRQRTAQHLAQLAHPLDPDYVECCTAARVEPEPLSLKTIFDWTDADGSGKLSREEITGAIATMRKLCTDPGVDSFPEMTDQAWGHLDEDGNGVVNFSEFACWAGPRMPDLPLGMRHLMKRTSTMLTSARPCSVIGCPCEGFTLAKKGDHETPASICATCKHKSDAHHTPHTTEEIPFPEYWSKKSGAQKQPEMDAASVAEFQQLLDKTYKNAWTRDRGRHNPANPSVPSGFQVLKVVRNENQDNWREYGARRAVLMARVTQHPVVEYPDVKSAAAWREIGGVKGDRLVPECNEWYLFHGAAPDTAQKICQSDFKISCAGSNTGTLYGKGLYLAESITKADEYAKPNARGNYTVLLCRVLGGQVRYTADAEPDPEALVYDCIQGDYDCVLGDREKCRGTFREFVCYDSEDVYPEYIIEYKRLY